MAQAIVILLSAEEELRIGRTQLRRVNIHTAVEVVAVKT